MRRRRRVAHSVRRRHARTCDTVDTYPPLSRCRPPVDDTGVDNGRREFTQTAKSAAIDEIRPPAAAHARKQCHVAVEWACSETRSERCDAVRSFVRAAVAPRRSVARHINPIRLRRTWTPNGRSRCGGYWAPASPAVAARATTDGPMPHTQRGSSARRRSRRRRCQSDQLSALACCSPGRPARPRGHIYRLVNTGYYRPHTSHRQPHAHTHTARPSTTTRPATAAARTVTFYRASA